MAEFSSPVDEETLVEWALFIDGISNIKWSNTRVVLEGPRDTLIEQTLKLEFNANNNQAEYEALIAKMILALEIVGFRLKAKVDSQLVSN